MDSLFPLIVSIFKNRFSAARRDGASASSSIFIIKMFEFSTPYKIPTKTLPKYFTSSGLLNQLISCVICFSVFFDRTYVKKPG